MANIGDLIIRCGMNIEEFVSGTVQVAKEADNMARAVEKNFAALDRVGDRLTDLGKGMSIAFTAPIAALGIAMGKAAVDFDDASDRIRAKTGATGEALAGLNNTFKEVFSSLPTTAKDASEAISGLATRLGLAGEPLKELATQELNLARITETSVAPLIASTTRLFGDWSIATKDQAGALDYLYKVTQSTGIGIQKLTELTVQFGAPMRALGLDMEHATALLGKWEKEGVNITTVLSGMRMELARMAKAGIDTSAGFPVIIEAIKNAKTEAEGLTMAVRIFGQRAAVDMFRAIKEGRFDVDALTESLKKNTETINKAAADTLSFADKWTVFKNKLETALEPIGTKLTGVLEKWMDASGPFLKTLENMADGFAKLEPSTQGWILAITAAVAAIGPALIGIGAMANGFAALAPVMALTVAGFTGFASAAANVASAVGSGLTGALTTGETIMLRMGQAAIVAAAAFAAWKIGEWAYANIPAVKALGDAMANLILKIPGVEAAILKLTGAQGAMSRASTDQAFAIQKLESSLKAHGVTIDRAGLSEEQYGAKLQEAAKGLYVNSAALDANAPKARGLAVDISALTEKHKLSAEQILKHQIALQKQADAYVEASAAVTKYKNNLDGLDNIKLAKLSLGGPDFKAYEEELKKFGAEMDAARVRVTTFYNEVTGGRNATEAIKELGAAFANTEKALQDFGIESKLSYQSLVKQNSDYLKQILNDTNLTHTQKEQALIVFAQREIDLARKTGQTITDAEIDNLAKQKAAYEKTHLDIEQSYKILGINSTAEIQRQADLVAAAYAKVAASSLSSQADIDKAHLAMMKADADATIAHGKAISETQKRTMADLEQITKNGHETLELEWDAFSNHIGDAIAGLSVALGEKLFTGKGSFGDICKTAWKSIQASLVSDFIKPAEEAISKFISKSIAALIGGEGIGGIQKAWKDATASMKEFFGAASAAAKSATKSGGATAGIPFGGDTSEADYNPGASAGGGDLSSGGGLSSFTPMGIISAGIDAAGFITIGLQLSHLIATVGKVEVNTREMSTVMWQTGAESLQGIGKRSLNELIYIGDRLNEIRDSLFDPVTTTLEGIWQTLKSGISVNGAVGSGSGDGTTTTAAFRQPGVGDPNFGPPKYLGFVGPLAGNTTAKDSLADLTRQLAEANAQLEKIKADRAVYAKELSSMSTGVDRRKELAAIDAINSDKQQGFEGTIKALQYTLDQLSKAVGRGTAEITQGITSLDGTIQASAITQGTAAADTAAAIQTMAETIQAPFVEGNTGSGSAYSIDLRATDRWGNIIDSVGNTLSNVGQSISNFGDVAAKTLTGFSDAVQDTAKSIVSTAASLATPSLAFADGPMLFPSSSDIAPSVRSNVGASDGIQRLTQGTVGGRTGSGPLIQINGGTFSSRAVVDEITSGLVDRLRREGGLKF